MKPKLHHINLSTKNVKKMKDFYKKILFLDNENFDIPKLEKGKAYSGEVEFMTDSAIQTHLAEIDNDLCFKTGLAINPLSKGHIAYRIDDLKKFKKHLEANNIKYSDWGETAISGWKQIFFHDPDGNIIEIHEKINN